MSEELQESAYVWNKKRQIVSINKYQLTDAVVDGNSSHTVPIFRTQKAIKSCPVDRTHGVK